MKIKLFAHAATACSRGVKRHEIAHLTNNGFDSFVAILCAARALPAPGNLNLVASNAGLTTSENSNIAYCSSGSPNQVLIHAARTKGLGQGKSLGMFRKIA